MEKNETKTTKAAAETKAEKPAKVNRYTILDAEIKALSKEKKERKAAMLKAQADALDAYRKWVKETYRPAKKAALEKFAASKLPRKPKAEKVEKPAKKAGKKVEVKKAAKTTKARKPLTKAECDAGIARGEAAIAKAKAAAAAQA